MKKIYTLFIFLILFQITNAQCKVGSIYTSNGISMPYNLDGEASEALIKSGETFDLEMQGNLCCGFELFNVRVYYNGELVFEQKEPAFKLKVQLPEKPGHYETICEHSQYSQDWHFNFDILPEKSENTIEVNETISDQTAESKKEDIAITLFPNPSHEGVNIVCDREQIVEFQIYDSLGNKVCSRKTNSNAVEASLKGLGAGIYTLHVFTGSGKPIVKTLSVL